jgi:hypothetical protein
MMKKLLVVVLLFAVAALAQVKAPKKSTKPPETSGRGTSMSLTFSSSGTISFPVASEDSQEGYVDKETGGLRLTHIRERLKDSSCPWTSDSGVVGWWNGEQPGVELRKWVSQPPMDGQLHMGGIPVANFHQGPYGAGGNAVNDAKFAAHSCADIQFLLDELARRRP